MGVIHRQWYQAAAVIQIVQVLIASMGHVNAQMGNQLGIQRQMTIFGQKAVLNCEATPVQVNVLDAQINALRQAQSAPVQ